ncbi:putative ubiquinol oxidase (non-electrogenic) [Dioscorea sansibarensis]
MAMMSSRSAGSLLRQLGPRLFSTAVVSRAAAAAEPSQALLYGPSIIATPARAPTTWVKLLSVRMASTSTPAQAEVGQQEEPATPPGGERKEVVSYWGVAPPKLMKEDGTEWKWSCFRPWDTYASDQTIDLKKHHKPTTLLDKIAFWAVKALRVPTDIFFQRRYGCRAMMLETVAAVPGMVGGMLLHLRSLRRFEHSGGWIRALLEEAENERMHLMTFMEVSQPRWYERALVLAVQGVFFNAYFIGYLISPKFAHRVVGYLEEEAIHSYTEFLKEIDAGRIPNVPAPAIAIDYWRLPANSTLRDVVMVVRADEAHHRDVNHYASDIQYQGMELQKTPAPLGYH